MSFKRRRQLKGQQGTELTTCDMRTLLPRVLGQIERLHQDRPDLIVEAWPDLIGSQLAPMTQATSFDQGILWVRVGNSTLYSVLMQHERVRLLGKLRERFPAVEIKNIVFRLGACPSNSGTPETEKTRE